MKLALFILLRAVRDIAIVVTSPLWLPLLMLAGALATIGIVIIDWYESARYAYLLQQQETIDEHPKTKV